MVNQYFRNRPGQPAGNDIEFEWYGGNFQAYHRQGVRRALERLGDELVDVAYPLAHFDTEAMRNSIRWELPRSERGSDRYILAFGIWDHEDNELRIKGARIENPVEYAMFQETQPPPIGKPFLTPAMDQVFPKLVGYIQDEFPRLASWGRLDFSVTDTELSRPGGGVSDFED